MLVDDSRQAIDISQAGESDPSVPAAITDTGCERDLNEDRYAVVESSSGVAWIVCDGMGGVTGGELAAQIAIDAIRRDLENLPSRRPDLALKSAILEANRIIVLRRQNPAFAGMGTTIVSAMFRGPEVAIAHVGDSRAYLVRDGAIQQLTIDHTFVQELVDKGQIRPEDALSHPQAHILTRCIGSEPGLDVVTQRYWIWPSQVGEPGDLLVLCSDGLYSLINEAELATIISQSTPQKACVKLVELTKERGGYDNITVSIVPLGGQLRQDPPEGYDEKAVERRFASQSIKKVETSTSLFKTLAVVFMLCCLAAMLTTLVVVFLVGK